MPTPPSAEVDEDVVAAEGATDDAGGAANAAPDESPAAPAPVAAQTGPVFSACHETRVVGCDAVYVRMVQSAPAVCVQLVLDNCGENGRLGLPVVVPISWRFTSGAAISGGSCDLREYDPKSQPVLSASGKVTFKQQGREISALNVDVQLALDAAPETKVPEQVAVTTPSPIAVGTCED